ncbi:thiamine pyrophosphate-dependent enzyme, partial [Enterobacter hormaechei]
IHSLAGAIGMGLALAIRTPIGNPPRHVVGRVGVGGVILKLCDLATLAQEKHKLTHLVINHRGYRVIPLYYKKKPPQQNVELKN